MSNETVPDHITVDNTREGRWECAVCGAIGPNVEYDTLKAHAKDKHPDKWDAFKEAELAMDGDVATGPIVGAIAISGMFSVGVFVGTWSLLAAFIAYVLGAVLSFVALWVMGYA